MLFLFFLSLENFLQFCCNEYIHFMFRLFSHLLFWYCLDLLDLAFIIRDFLQVVNSSVELSYLPCYWNNFLESLSESSNTMAFYFFDFFFLSFVSECFFPAGAGASSFSTFDSKKPGISSWIDLSRHLYPCLDFFFLNKFSTAW